MTHPETTALRLAEAATPGPWEVGPADRVVSRRAGFSPRCKPTLAAVTYWPVGPRDQVAANAAHIAHAHPGRVRAWLGAVARLRLIVAQGHMSWCKGKGAFGDGDDCTCGHDLDLAALAAVDAEG